VKIRSDLHVRVYEALGAAGIQIPFPQHDLHLRTVSPAAGESAGRRQPSPAAAWAGAPEPARPPDVIEAELLGPGARGVTAVLSGAVLVLAAISAPWRVWLEDASGSGVCCWPRLLVGICP